MKQNKIYKGFEALINLKEDKRQIFIISTCLRVYRLSFPYILENDKKKALPYSCSCYGRNQNKRLINDL